MKNAASIIIRKAVPGDISSLVEYNLALASETENLQLDRDILRSGVEQVMNRPELGQYFVAETERKVFGQTLITYEWSYWRAGVLWWMQSVYVHPGYRSRGLFKALFNYIKNAAEKDPQVSGLRLYVKGNNQSGREIKNGVFGEIN